MTRLLPGQRFLGFSPLTIVHDEDLWDHRDHCVSYTFEGGAIRMTGLPRYSATRRSSSGHSSQKGRRRHPAARCRQSCRPRAASPREWFWREKGKICFSKKCAFSPVRITHTHPTHGCGKPALQPQPRWYYSLVKPIAHILPQLIDSRIHGLGPVTAVLPEVREDESVASDRGEEFQSGGHAARHDCFFNLREWFDLERSSAARTTTGEKKKKGGDGKDGNFRSSTIHRVKYSLIHRDKFPPPIPGLPSSQDKKRKKSICRTNLSCLFRRHCGVARKRSEAGAQTNDSLDMLCPRP